MILKVKGTAVGFMSVCSKVDVELLSSCFDLKPFNGLQKLQGQTPGKFAINLSIKICACTISSTCSYPLDFFAAKRNFCGEIRTNHLNERHSLIHVS